MKFLSTRAVCRWAAALLAALVVLTARADDIREVASHQVCCWQASDDRLKLGFSGLVVKDWAGMLRHMMPNLSAEQSRCLHKFSITNAIRTPGHSVPSRDEESTFEHRFSPFGHEPEPQTKAQCVSISFFVPRTTEPLASTVDFFQPLFLEKLTLERPTIEIERGTAEFIDGPEGTDIATYRRISKTSHSYEDVYVKGNKKFATEQELRNVVSSLSCIRSDDRLCNAAFAFIEAVTGTRVPEEYELGLLTKENLKNVLTLSKLESIDFAKEMKKLEKEVKKPRSKKEKIMYEMNKGKSWVKMVPETAVRRLGGSSKGMSIRTLPEGKKREKNDEEEWYDSFFDFEGFCPKYFDALRARAREIVKSPPKSRTRMISAYTTSQVAALFDRSTSKKKGDERSRFTSRRGTEVSPTQITNFLLVDSLLAVTEAKYSDRENIR